MVANRMKSCIQCVSLDITDNTSSCDAFLSLGSVVSVGLSRLSCGDLGLTLSVSGATWWPVVTLLCFLLARIA